MYSIGVDVGGTGIKIGVVNELGDILYRSTCETEVKGGFNKIIARTNFNMLFMAMIFLVILATLKRYGNISLNIEQSISTKVAMVMLGVYLLGLVFSLITHKNNFVVSEEGEEIEKRVKGNILKMVVKLFLISISLYFVSEKLIGNVKIVVESYNISEGFMGIILIPLLGNIGENTSAIMGALRNKVNLSLETAIGSSIQMALFVTPIMVILSVFIGINLTLFFSVFHVIILAEFVRDMGHIPEQVQDFYPTPGSLSTVMYYTGINPFTGKTLYVPKTEKDKQTQRALLQYSLPQNHALVKEALLKENRYDLIGNTPKCLIKEQPSFRKKSTSKGNSSKSVGKGKRTKKTFKTNC